MKIHSSIAVPALVAAGLTALLTAGPVDPPAGPVAPSYKTLSEVEPRTVINAANTPGTAASMFRINKPGSYYLEANIFAGAGKSCILVDASNVTIDLNGFELRGVGSNGVEAGAFIGMTTLRNGTIIGAFDGVRLGSLSTVTDVRVISSSNDGIEVGAGSSVSRCQTVANGLSGIRAAINSAVTDCVATDNGSHGIAVSDGSAVSRCRASANGASGIDTASDCTVTDCVANLNIRGITGLQDVAITRCTANTNVIGIDVAADGVIMACSAADNTQFGIQTGGGARLSGCTANGNASHGVVLGPDSSMTDCVAIDNDHAGIFAQDGARIDRCTASHNGHHGISTGDRSRITDCLVEQNTANGLVITSLCTVTANSCAGNGQSGIKVLVNQNRLEGNTCSANATGVDILGASNFFARNTCVSNPTNWSVAPGNMGLVVPAPAGPGFSGSSGGASPGSTDPNANFSH